jgi:hypothetical protein
VRNESEDEDLRMESKEGRTERKKGKERKDK